MTGPAPGWTLPAQAGRSPGPFKKETQIAVYIADNAHEALLSLLQHRMRTLLTTLGILFGVASVVAMLAIGKGAEQEAIEQIKAMGLNDIRILSVHLESSVQQRFAQAGSVGLSYDDARYIGDLLPYVVAIAPQNLLDKKVQVGTVTPHAQIVGTTPGYAKVAGQDVEEGRFLDQGDVVSYRKVCVLGHKIAQEAFLRLDPIGQTVDLGTERYQVVGVMHDRRAGMDRVKIKTRDVNNDIYIPLTTSIERFSMPRSQSEGVNQADYGIVDEIALEVDKSSRLEEARQTLAKILKRRHREAPDFKVIVPDELLAQSQKTQRLFNIIMGCLAGISLLVGGIGIMNIMLATITERTREVGLRRALGAKRRDILFYFLTEALLICVIGGLAGVGVGILLAALISAWAGWRTVITFGSVVLAFVVSSAVGLFFGIFPARRAASLDPITALRYE